MRKKVIGIFTLASMSILSNTVDTDKKIMYRITENRPILGVTTAYKGRDSRDLDAAFSIYCHKIHTGLVTDTIPTGIKFYGPKSEMTEVALIKFDSKRQCKDLEKMVQEASEENPVYVELNVTDRKFTATRKTRF